MLDISSSCPLGDLEDIVDNYKVEEVIIAIAEINGERLREVVKRCRKKNIVCRIIPCFSRLLEMNSNVRNVEPADLMRRLPRDLDLDKIKDYLHGKSILISGAAGSIGSELVKQVLRYEPKIVIAFDQSEFGLYSLRESLGDSGIKYVLGDVANKDYVENVFEMEKLDIVFHAAAYKHVPLLESNNAEAIRNNVGGTKVLAETSDKYGVKSFILISTDKAVKPSSIMGATKRACELVVQGFSSFSKTRFVAVRFGNVLGSSGSVVPKFLDQIMRGGPVTVTHPEATRYFMLIDEAVQLVLQAAAIGNGGEIFILNMGKPVKISEMAEDLIFLMGRQPHKDIKIEYIGLRDGEKVHEELLNEETEEKTRFEDITIGKTKVPEWEWFNSRIDHILKFYGDNNHETVQTLKEIVPEGEWGS
ncbi:MAG: polysaccharide biosynthesis protein [Deltaproteobacteria bacterium]|nr:polysaccharide biosynthesis protein [Deltaproteobacteria bacterium]